MTKKAIIFDLDNTVYSAPEVGDDLFSPLLRIIEQDGGHNSTLSAIKMDMMRKPFQVLASLHGFSESLTQQGIQHLQTLTYNKPMYPFPDYGETRNLPLDKYLVTSGFYSLQMSKIKNLGIEDDFKEIHIVDIAGNTKGAVFRGILERHGYRLPEVLVIGDDLHSEIPAARELGIDAVLYDKLGMYPEETSLPRITDYKDLLQWL